MYSIEEICAKIQNIQQMKSLRGDLFNEVGRIGEQAL
jgi:hypothetical protein